MELSPLLLLATIVSLANLIVFQKLAQVAVTGSQQPETSSQQPESLLPGKSEDLLEDHQITWAKGKDFPPEKSFHVYMMYFKLDPDSQWLSCNHTTTNLHLSQFYCCS